jgi:hypothetical protein
MIILLVNSELDFILLLLLQIQFKLFQEFKELLLILGFQTEVELFKSDKLTIKASLEELKLSYT